MDLDKGLELLTTWNALLCALGVIVIMFFIRVPVERLAPAIAMKKWWRDVLMPLLPPVIGGLMGGFLGKFPFPAGIQSLSARVIYGAVCGFLSGWLYAYLKKVLKSKGIEVPGVSSVPPAASNESLKPVEVPETHAPPKDAA